MEVDGETLHMHGIDSQGENVADNGDIKDALRCASIIPVFQPHGGGERQHQSCVRNQHPGRENSRQLWYQGGNQMSIWKTSIQTTIWR
jgi:hypothetical protein